MLKNTTLIVLILLFVLLQISIWSNDGTRATLQVQNEEKEAVKRRIMTHKKRNMALEKEIRHLRNSPAEIEARARHDLGMIKKDETFILMPNEQTP